MNEVQYINEPDFEDVVLRSEVPVLVEFSSVLCGPCNAMRPVLDDLAADLGDDGKVVVVEITINQRLADEYKISGVPTFIAFRNGKPWNRMVGMQSKAMLLEALAA